MPCGRHHTHTGTAQVFWLGFTMRGKCLKAELAIVIFFLPFLFLWGDYGSRGWYDNPHSVLRPHTGVIQCTIVPGVCKLSVNGWCIMLSETGVGCVGGPWCCTFIVPNLGYFVSSGVGQVYTMPTAADWPRVCPPIPERLHSIPWCIREPGMVHMADSF